MAVTFSSLRLHLRHALAGRPSSRLSETQIINEAGRFMTSMKDWKWRVRSSKAINLVADQNYIDMPDDFGELIHIKMGNNLLDSSELSTLDEIDEYRNLSLTSATYRLIAALSWPAATDNNSVPAVPRLEMWPTPASDTTKTVVVRYRSAWCEMLRNEDVASIPLFMESLLTACVRAFALGYEEDVIADVIARTDRIEKSQLFRLAVKADSRQQRKHGPVRNGAIRQRTSLGYLPYTAPSAPA